MNDTLLEDPLKKNSSLSTKRWPLIMVLFLVIITLIPSYGQQDNKNKIATVDSLIEAIETSSGFDFLPEAELIIQLSESIQYQEGLYMGYWYISNLKLLEEDFEAAANNVKLLLEVAGDDINNIIAAYSQLINIYCASEELDKALEAVTQMLYHAELSGLGWAKAETYFLYSLIYAIIEDYEKEKEYLLRSLKLFTESDNSDDEFSLPIPYLEAVVGSMYTNLEQLDSAFHHLSKAELLFNDPEYDNLLIDKALFHSYFGDYYMDTGQYQQAEKHYQLALEIELDFGSDLRIASYEVNVATCKMYQQQYSAVDSMIGEIKSRASTVDNFQVQLAIAELEANYIIRTRLKNNDLNKVISYIDLEKKDEKLRLLQRIETFKNREELILKEFEINGIGRELKQRKTVNYLLSSLGFVLAVVLFLLYTQYKTYKKMKTREFETERQKLQIQESENKLLDQKLDNLRQSIISKSLLHAQMHNILDELSEMISKLKNNGKTFSIRDLEQLNRKIDLEKNKDQNWQDIMGYFEKVNPGFNSELTTKFPDLTQRDLRLCTLIKVNLSNQEIGQLLNISNASVNTARYRLRKKMGLSEETDLNKYLGQL